MYLYTNIFSIRLQAYENKTLHMLNKVIDIFLCVTNYNYIYIDNVRTAERRLWIIGLWSATSINDRKNYTVIYINKEIDIKNNTFLQIEISVGCY